MRLRIGTAMLMYHTRRTALFASLLVVSAAMLGAAGPAPLKRDAELLKEKFATMAKRAERPSREVARTTVTEKEVNAYLAYEAVSDLPTGVVDPSVSILGAKRIMGRAVVDLDKVRQQRNPTSLLDPMRYLRGRLQVSATGLVHAADGVGSFELESADVAGVPIPKFVLQEIVSYYSRSAERPSGFTIDDRFTLPAGVREIQVERGHAILVQ